MMQFNNLHRMFRTVAVLIVASLLTVVGCTKVDDTLGSNLIPDDQQMKVGFTILSGKLKNGEINPKKYFETRLYQTDSIVSSNLSVGYMGSMLNDTFGMRNAGFFSQYLSYYKVDSGYFGVKPIFDSAQIVLSIASYGGDTLSEQTFCVYEIISNKYLTEKPIAEGKSERDTTFYINFDPVKAGIVGSDVLFRFNLGNTTGPATKTVTMTPTPAGTEFIQRLMLQKGEYKGDYSIYSSDSTKQWVEAFKGLYIVPEKDETTPGKGAIYSTTLESTGLSIFGRTRNPDDLSLIKDTIGMVYYFYDKYAKHGNVSVNTVRHDYELATSPARVDIAQARETNPDRQPSRRIYVEGMGGVISELTFTKEFFEELEAIREQENAVSGKEFSTLAVSQARLMIFFTESDYDWQNLGNIPHMIEEMNASITRLGTYTNYKRLMGIADYAYAYEQNYQTELAYGGRVNRSKGCYIMDISAYIQGLWNSYLEEVETAKKENRVVDLDKIKNRSVYIGPEAYGLYSPAYTVLQGMTFDLNNAPVKIDLTYNMIK